MGKVFYWCLRCKEPSAVIKLYGGKKIGTSMLVEKKRVMYCVNKGCGWRQEFPLVVLESSKKEGV